MNKLVPSILLRNAFERLQNRPYGEYPGGEPGSRNHIPIRSEADWDAYGWNPPEHLLAEEPYEPDPNAGAKPTWDEILDIIDGLFRENSSASAQYTLRLNCQKYIVRHVYGAINPVDELHHREKGRETQDEREHRDRIRGYYQEVKTNQMGSSKRHHELEVLANFMLRNRDAFFDGSADRTIDIFDQIDEDGELYPLDSDGNPIRPTPPPLTRATATLAEWTEFNRLLALYRERRGGTIPGNLEPGVYYPGIPLPDLPEEEEEEEMPPEEPAS